MARKPFELKKPENKWPLGYLVEQEFRIFLGLLAFREEYRKEDGRFGRKELYKLKETLRGLWKFLNKNLLENENFQAMAKGRDLSDEDFPLWWKTENTEKVKKVSFRYLDFFFKVEVTEDLCEEKVVSVDLKHRTDYGDMNFQSRYPLHPTTLEDDGLPF